MALWLVRKRRHGRRVSMADGHVDLGALGTGDDDYEDEDQVDDSAEVRWGPLKGGDHTRDAFALPERRPIVMP
jgi:hypothetical protein